MVRLPNGERGYDVPGFPGYAATRSGTVWSCRRRGPGNGFGSVYVELVGGTDRDGYRKLILCVDGVRFYKRLHFVILETFRGPCPTGYEGRHLNGNRKDNRISNLRWSTHVENIADKRRHGTHQYGERVGTAKQTDKQARRVKRLLLNGSLSRREIARAVGVPPHFVTNIKNGAWSHVKV